MAFGFVPGSEKDLDVAPGELWYARVADSPNVFGALIIHVSARTVCFQESRAGAPVRRMRGEVTFIEKVE